jgi:ABC-type multidrug transport system ATPase subunit
MQTMIAHTIPTDEDNIGTAASVHPPHPGTTLEWKGINYQVPVRDKPGEVRTLLHPMSGFAYPGEILAIMGTSGAGKSTLLDVLAGRLESDDLKGGILSALLLCAMAASYSNYFFCLSYIFSGALLVNNSLVNSKAFRKESGYVMQSDALFPLLTVRETFRYAAYLRVRGTTTAERNQIADELITELKLNKVADTIVGDDEHRGLSGGEKRRVSIGVDIVHFPSTIFLDEPTSGLDSSTAVSVVETLKQLALKQNCTILMTVHQPSIKLYNLLDKLLFLSAGHVTFYGTTKELTPFILDAYSRCNIGTCIAEIQT